jgi:hypothetical protein
LIGEFYLFTIKRKTKTKLYRIIESVKAGKRLSEARFVVSLEKNSNNNNKNALIGASRGQRSVYGMFKGAG